MTISRRSFARSIIAALAGATVLRQAVATPVKEQIAEALPQTIAGPELAIAWKAYHIGARRITVMCSVSRELLEDSPFDIRSLVEGRLAAAMVQKIDEEWGKGVEYTVAKTCDEDPAKQIVSYGHIATEDKDYRMQRLREEWRRMHVGPRNVTTLPGGWEMRQYVPYKAADGQPAVFWDHA